MGSPQRRVLEISLADQARLWAGPIVTALISVPIFLISAAVLIFYIPRHLHSSYKLELIASFSLLTISAIATWGSASGFYKIARRKLKTGTFFPAEEELTEWRNSLKKPAGWQKIVIPAAFCMIAWGSTQEVLIKPNYHHPVAWVVPALMWIAAILIIFVFVLPSAPQWIGSALAAVWCLAGLWYMISVLASHSRGVEYWTFPFVMFVMAAAIVIGRDRHSQENTG